VDVREAAVDEAAYRGVPLDEAEQVAGGVDGDALGARARVDGDVRDRVDAEVARGAEEDPPELARAPQIGSHVSELGPGDRHGTARDGENELDPWIVRERSDERSPERRRRARDHHLHRNTPLRSSSPRSSKLCTAACTMLAASSAIPGSSACSEPKRPARSIGGPYQM